MTSRRYCGFLNARGLLKLFRMPRAYVLVQLDVARKFDMTTPTRKFSD